jgi:LemA protein
MKTGMIVLLAVGFAVVLGGCQFIQTRNKLATEKVAIGANFAQMDTELQRRSDLIPNLVETVKGYAKEETGVMEALANARAAMIGAKSPAEKAAANSQIDSALGRLMVVVENYPNLKANENFKQLQYSLEGTENRILQSRRVYNETIQAYNADLAVFPANIVASLSGFQPETAYFKTEPGARNAPKVQF